MKYAVPADLAYVVAEGSEPSRECATGPASAEGEDPRVFLVHLPDGIPVVLVGIGALIWLLAIEGEVDIGAKLAAALVESDGEVAPTVDAYVNSLVAAGLLCQVVNDQQG